VRFIKCWLFALWAAVLPGLTSVLAAEPAATIISVTGTGQFAETDASPWLDAESEQALSAGNLVRTAEFSRMGLLFRDRTQIRLNEKTRLRIKEAETETRLQISLGRAWTQTRTLPNRLYMETPSATAAIRGTDWDIEVDENGRTMITVLSGEVDFFNDFGRVQVAANESAEAEIGKAPSKLILVRPKDRVQWVNAFAIEPLRHISLSTANPENASSPVARGKALAELGRWREAAENFQQALRETPDSPDARIGLGFAALHEGEIDEALTQFDRAAGVTGEGRQLLKLGRIAALIQQEKLGQALANLKSLTREQEVQQPAAFLLLAELMLYAGETGQAVQYLQAGVSRFPGDARLYAALSRAWLAAGETGKSREAAEQALQQDQHTVEARLAEGELARIEGDGETAVKAFSAAIEQNPADDRGWFGMGRIHTEKEEVPQARSKLLRAIELNADGLGYQGELGTLETFANNFNDAGAAFIAALKRKPDDYVALTGLGLLELKRGQTQAGLEKFLRASLIEPRFARVHVYIAVAYYQMELAPRALESLRKASELDDKDPIPHLMASIIYNDLLRPADAITSARKALKLMPNLKSLNQLANNQRGTTNLGQAFAFFGMEEWAQNYAQESYNQFWAGSHLFLADRYQGLFTKNSELFQGFLADPTAFGNSNRNQTLMQKPGNYFTGSIRGLTAPGSLNGGSPLMQANGFANGVVPMAYFASQERFNLELGDGPVDLTSTTAALGVAPRHDIGVFLFATKNHNKTEIVDPEPGNEADFRDIRNTTNVDFGLHYKLSPDSQIWFKYAQFRSSTRGEGAVLNFPIRSIVRVRQPEHMLRHTFKLGERHEITWGAERAERKTLSDFRTDFSDADFPGLFSVSDFLYDETTYDFYLSDRWRPAPPLLLQAELFYQHQHRDAGYLRYPIFLNIPELEFADFSDQSISRHKLQPRIGLVYKFTENALIRMAYQQWLRPAQFSTLGPVATAGIALDDNFIERGGQMTRYRGQFEWEVTPRNFVTAYYDFKKGRNNPFTRTPFTIGNLQNLDRLTSRDLGSLVRDDLTEFSLPSEGAGRLQNLGFSLNHLLNQNWALFGRYVHASSENRSEDFRNNDLPFLSDDAAAIGATFIHPAGWYFVSRLERRAGQFQDEANTQKGNAVWNGATDLYWQPRDKRYLLRLSADNAFNKDAPASYVGEITVRF